MITVTDTGTEITVKGHAADYEHPRNEETVQACASITALVQCLIYSIHEHCGDLPSVSITKGDFSLEKTNLSEKALFLSDCFITGCQFVQTAYPEHIKVILSRRE